MNQLKKSFILLLVISLLVSTTNIQVFALSSLFDQSEIMDSNKESNHIDVIEEAEDKQEKHGNVEEVEDTQEKQESVEGAEDTQEVTGMLFSYNQEKVDAVIADTYKMEGIYYIKVWLNEGMLSVGDNIMYVLIGGDIRPRVVDALQYLVGRIKNECVVEKELN